MTYEQSKPPALQDLGPLLLLSWMTQGPFKPQNRAVLPLLCCQRFEVFWFFWKQPVSFTFQNSSHNPDLIVPFSSVHQKTANPRSQLDRKSDLGWRVMPCTLRILSRNLEERYRSTVCSRVRKPGHTEATKAIQSKNCWTLGTGN